MKENVRVFFSEHSVY